MNRNGKRLLANLPRFTGIDASLIDPKTLVLGRQQFAEQLLRDRKQVLARYDTRQITSGAPIWDADHRMLINKYLRSTLSVQDRPGVPGNRGRIHAGQSRCALSRSANSGTTTRDPPTERYAAECRCTARWSPALVAPRHRDCSPSLKAFVAAGWYDSLNSCAGHDYLVKQLEPELRRNITVKLRGRAHDVRGA